MTGARAAEIGAEAFRPPILDGVEVQDRGAELTTYAFDGRRDWPAIRLVARQPLDWSAAGSLALPVDNPGEAPFKLLLRLDDNPGADGGDTSLTGLVDIPAHHAVTVLLPFASGPAGMRGRPPGAIAAGPADLIMPDTRGAADLHHIVALHISGLRSGGTAMLRIGTPRLREGGGASTSVPLVDAFGQAIAGDWPEKVRDAADLRRRLDMTSDQARGAKAAADVHGGSPEATLRATGFFRTEKRAGRWTLVTPDGHPFFSLGIDAVMASNPTIVAGREQLFRSLPGAADPLARFYGSDAGRRTFDVGIANLERAWGVDWPDRWRDDVLLRLKAWGFNTLGNWSEARLAGGGLASVVFYDVEGASAAVPMTGGRSLPDPFDPRFAGVAAGVARAMTAAHRAERDLLGYFSGNELPWGRSGDVAARVLALGPGSFAKQALIAELRARYGTAAAFASAWNLAGIATWTDASLRTAGWPDRPSATAARDLAAFGGRFATLYFRTVAQAIKREDPDHLYLGTRFAAAPPEVVAACAAWCDVISFNVYGATPAEAAVAWRPYDRPVLIGEFHFGSRDRGAFWPGMVDVGTEAARGPAYAAYLAAAVRDPAIVGCHWYQYADEPLTGRPYDGENGHIGLVSVANVPFAGFVAAVTAANRQTLATFARQVR